MKNYLIKSFHNISIDSYSEGQKETVNNYSNEKRLTAISVKDAIQLYFEKELYKSFNPDCAFVDGSLLCYNHLVDSNNKEVTHNDNIYQKWTEGNEVLYIDDITINISELIYLDIELELAIIINN